MLALKKLKTEISGVSWTAISWKTTTMSQLNLFPAPNAGPDTKLIMNFLVELNE